MQTNVNCHATERQKPVHACTVRGETQRDEAVALRLQTGLVLVYRSLHGVMQIL